MFKNTTILVTGGTGSWGQTLTRMLLKYDPKQIIIFSRGELPQVLMSRKFNNSKIKYVLGDVRDIEAVSDVMVGVDYVFHLAALKHVPVCEENVLEAIKTNIDGTKNIARCAVKNKVKKVIDVSSDKAVEPVNLYGMTKAVGEKITLNANSWGDTRFVCIRGGNVMGSNGSVIPLFKEQIEKGKITITDERMTRFFLTLESAINLIFKATENSIGGETFVMNMPACSITDLAEVLIDDKPVEIEITGIRGGEKLHEVLLSEEESKLSYIYDNDYYLILPPYANEPLLKKYEELTPMKQGKFTSNDVLMTKSEIYWMLKNGNFL